MRLRSTFILVLIIGTVVAVGAWADRTKVALAKGPSAVPAGKPWDAMVEISRHGRRLDGFRPVLTITGLGKPASFHGKEIASGRYRVQVIFPQKTRLRAIVNLVNDMPRATDTPIDTVAVADALRPVLLRVGRELRREARAVGISPEQVALLVAIK
jgi:hypothetical protein